MRSFGRAVILIVLAGLAVGASFAAAPERSTDAARGASRQPLRSPAEAPGHPSFRGPTIVVPSALPEPSHAGTDGERASPAPRRQRPEDGHSSADVPAANVIDQGNAASLRAPPTVSDISFEGLNNDDNEALTGWDVWPADAQVAVGPDHVFELVNVSGGIFDLKGEVIEKFALVDFFDVPDGNVDFDPKVIYDALSDRWFATYIAFANSPTTHTQSGCSGSTAAPR